VKVGRGSGLWEKQAVEGGFDLGGKGVGGRRCLCGEERVGEGPLWGEGRIEGSSL
jgi:hypothetical protein